MWTLILVTILLAFSGVFYKAESAKFTSRPPRGVIKARIGDDVTLNWTFTLDSGEALLLYEVQYSKGKVFDNSAKRIAYILQDKVTVMNNYKVSVEPTGTVTLHNVTEQERGYYKCTLSLANTVNIFSDTVEVYVGTPPVITSPSTSKMKLLEDDELNVSCDTQGNPSPVALWYRPKKNDLKILAYSRLQIKNVKRSDAGNYSCMASNIMATVEKSLTLEVLERPVVTSFFHTSSVDNVLYECESVTIVCEVRDCSPPIKNISIYHENRLVYRRTNTFNGRKSERNKMDTPGSAGQLRLKQVRKKDEGHIIA
ncbi:hemicentin-1-like isoform X2 [Xenia sp. Carnegie-2017]|nr:hemicentin-1-like isoform X2 [Xenia sp. Carnegie-2017]